MKRDLITLALIISTINVLAVQLPDWFMHPSSDTYVGISVPGGSAQDAICMALIQYTLAHDVPCRNEIPLSESQTSNQIYNSSYQPSAQIDSFFVQYTIRELSLLSSGEYICQITTGDKMSQVISMSFNRNVMIMSDGTNKTIRENLLFRFKYGTSYVLEYYDNTNSINGVVEEQGKFASIDRANNSFTNFYLPDENIQHTFPKTKSPAQSKSYIPINSSTSLAPQLLRAYMEIMTNIIAGKEGIRKATPIVGFSNDDEFGLLLLHHTF